MHTTTDFWVGDRLVRPALSEIQLGPERVHLEPRSMEVLLALAESPGEVLSKETLIGAVWGDAFVSDEVLTHAVWDLRRAFGDNASDPEFIQTIPKKGYRLIAPVKPVGRPRRRATDRLPTAAGRGWRSPWIRAAVLLAIAAGLAAWLGRSRAPEPPPRPATVEELLILLPTEAPPGYDGWGPRLDLRLLDGLTDLESLAVRQGVECAADGAAERTYCLEAVLLSMTDAAELGVSLREAPSARELYVSPVSTLATGDDLDAAARRLSELVRAYFDVVHDPWSTDPDLAPWFNLRRHDPRAVRDFLLGVRYVYRHDTGGGDPLALATATDPEFIAPRVWRTPTLAGKAAPEALASHRLELERLYERGSSFEKAMIQWTLAILDGDPAEQIRQLEVALESEPGNRPVINARGLAHLLLDEFEEAWRDLGPLVEARWHFPGLYPAAAYCAARRDRLGDLRRVLDAALELEVVDLNSLILLVQLAIFDDDAGRQGELEARLASRRKQQPDGLDPDTVDAVADYLAGEAEAAGRSGVAARLRESAI